VTSADLSSEEDTLGRSTALIVSFTSPFAGMTPAEVNTAFQEFLTRLELDLVSHCHFVILDEQTIEDNSCLNVHDGENFDPDDKLTFLRTDFYAAMNIVGQADLGVTELGEGLGRDKV